jgi:hypothetical protein
MGPTDGENDGIARVRGAAIEPAAEAADSDALHGGGGGLEAATQLPSFEWSPDEEVYFRLQHYEPIVQVGILFVANLAGPPLWRIVR